MTTLGWKERHGQTDWVQIMLRTKKKKKKKRKIFPLWCNRIIWTSLMLLSPQNDVTEKKPEYVSADDVTVNISRK